MNTRQFEARTDFRPYFDSELRKLIKKKHKTRGEEKRKLRKEIRCLLRRKKRKARTDFCSRGLQDRSGKMLWSTFRKSRGQESKGGVDVSDSTKAKECAEHFAQFHVIREALRPKSNALPESVLETVDHKCDAWCSPHRRPVNENMWTGESLFTQPVYLYQQIPRSTCPVYLDDPVTASDISAVLKILPKKGSRGLDDISYLLLKQSGEKTIERIAKCADHSLRTGEIASWWKVASVIPLAKPSGGYRPISLLSNLGKLVERIVASRIRRWSRSESVIPWNQFSDHGGTQVALQRFVDYIRSNSPGPTYCVFFDVRKAFDRVHIPTLIQILCDLKCPGYLTRWIANYMSDRKCCVGCASYPLTNGVPQGSVLGPVLFQIYVSRVLKNVSVFGQAYADDFLIACGGCGSDVAEMKLNEALKTIDIECKRIGLELDGKNSCDVDGQEQRKEMIQ